MSLVCNDDKYIAVKYFRYRKDPSIKGANICNSFDEVIEHAFDELDESINRCDKHYHLYVVFYETPIKITDPDVSIIAESQLDCNNCVSVNNAYCQIVLGNGKENDEKDPIRYGYSSDAIIVYKTN